LYEWPIRPTALVRWVVRQVFSVDSATDSDAPAQLLPDEFLHVVPVDLAHINGALGIDCDGRGVV
jgi:hypothetical protein